MARWYVAAVLIGILAACGTGDGGGGSDVGGSGGDTGGGGSGGGPGGSGGGEGGSGGSGGENGAIAWEPCALEYGGTADCATLSMPLDRDDPETQTIPFFVRRIRANGEARGQLWLLQGGPGYNGSMLGYYAEYFASGLGLDMYIPDYRGVGRSAHLGCGAGVSQSTCMNRLETTYGEDLARFSTSDAVLDIGEAIGRLRRPGEQVFVWGSSYGTVTAHRFLHLFPDLADGVVFDSSCGAAGCEFTTADVDYDRTAHDIADLCGADPFCRGKLGDDPWARVADVLDRVEAGHCGEAVAAPYRAYVRAIFTSLAGASDAPAVAMALIARLDRCEAGDVDAIRHLIGLFLGVAPMIEDTTVESRLLYYNIVFNELWDSSKTYDELAAVDAGLVATTGAVLDLANRHRVWSWPRYEVAADLRAWADVDVPVLFLNGTLDSQTRWEHMADAAEAFDGPGQNVVIVPYANHAVILTSDRTAANPSVTCGVAITRQFLTSPTADLDLSCLEEQTPPRFEEDQYGDYWFGTSELWENVQAARPVIVDLDDPDFRWRLDQGRSRLQHLFEN